MSSSSSLLPSSVRLSRSSTVEDHKLWQLCASILRFIHTDLRSQNYSFYLFIKIGSKLFYLFANQSTQNCSPTKRFPSNTPILIFLLFVHFLSLQSFPKQLFPSEPSPTLTCQQTNTPLISIKSFPCFLCYFLLLFQSNCPTIVSVQNFGRNSLPSKWNVLLISIQSEVKYFFLFEIKTK